MKVTNVGAAPVTLYPFALIWRHGTPQVSANYILHEGLIGYLASRACRNTATRKSTTPVGQLQRHPTAGWHDRQYWGPRRCCRTPRAILQARYSSIWSAQP